MLAALLLATGVANGGVAAAVPAPRRQDAAMPAWLAGHWRADDGSSEEVWLAPAGDTMAGVHRTLAAPAPRIEFLRIERRDAGIAYIAMPDGQPATEFVASALSGDEVRFENPAHDFPTWIRYRLTGPGRLRACIGGADDQGDGRCWEWRRLAP